MQHRNAPLTPNGRRRLVAPWPACETAPPHPTTSPRSPARPTMTVSARSAEGRAGDRG